MQLRQRPHTTWPSPLTRSPGWKSLTLSPPATISPTNSWPTTSGTGTVRCAQASQRWMCTSVPQMPVRCTRIRTSLMPYSGSGTSSSQRPGSGRLFTSARILRAIVSPRGWVTSRLMREPRFDVLFEPVQIGPVVARNRFFQVPHCNGMGYRDPTAHAHMRGIKAEGGWAVVCTEEVEIHASSEVAPFIEGRLWDDRDIPMHARLCEQVHAHGSLAGIELCYNGIAAPNRYSRISPMAPSALPVKWNDPVQARAMTTADIADVRRWHRQAVARSLEAGYDIVYVYAGHNLSIVQHFLSRRYNQRTDEYGGCIQNRTRLLREVLEDTLAEAEGRAGVVCRIAVDERIGAPGLERSEIQEVLGLVGELPDCWDFMLGSWPDDSVTSRFQEEGGQEPYVRGLKALTTKPVVGVG